MPTLLLAGGGRIVLVVGRVDGVTHRRACPVFRLIRAIRVSGSSRSPISRDSVVPMGRIDSPPGGRHPSSPLQKSDGFL
jgi:hypothetical protein